MSKAPRQAMLACKPTKGIVFPMLASAKIDGIRAIVHDGVVLAGRSLKPIKNIYVQELFGHHKFNGLDGELIDGEPNTPDTYDRTKRTVTSYSKEGDFRFYVFDLVCEEDATSRLLRANKICCDNYHTLNYVCHQHIGTQDELTKYEELVMDLGYEGVMLKNPEGFYKHGRSTPTVQQLVKIKRFVDSDAEIIGFQQFTSNTNEKTIGLTGRSERSAHKGGKVAKEKLGAWLVRDVETGVEFKVGTGFTEKQRVDMWSRREEHQGCFIKYKHFPIGVVDKPRHPVFLGFRDKLDML